ncbi:MAG: NAD(P)/FAD-dependent oxidoreductase, partial [Nitrospirota bacterium]
MKFIPDVIIIGGGLAGLSAALYLGRSKRQTLLIHSGRSMAKWETDVQNYLGFPDGIDGRELLNRGHAQVARFHVEVLEDEIRTLNKKTDTFEVQGQRATYQARRLLIATGLTHLPPDIPGVKECLGKSLFFCKDCDAYRLQGKRLVIIGANNEAADY